MSKIETMSDKPVRLTTPPDGYADWLADLKGRIHGPQQRATLAVNRELVLLYWQIGRDILAQQAAAQLPWFHLCTLMDKLKNREERDWYPTSTKLNPAILHPTGRELIPPWKRHPAGDELPQGALQ